jgi:hypothetical protein
MSAQTTSKDSQQSAQPTPSVPFKSSHVNSDNSKPVDIVNIDDIAAISAQSSGMLLETLNSNGEEKYD